MNSSAVRKAISKQTTRELQRLAERRRKAEATAEAAREDFLRAVEKARTYGATFDEIGDALGVSKQRIHQLLR
jgi:hypothetical protein